MRNDECGWKRWEEYYVFGLKIQAGVAPACACVLDEL